MKFELDEHFTAASGRACKNSQVYTRTNRHTGRVVSVKLCNPYKGEASSDQQKVRTDFAKRQEAARNWRALNAPTKQNPQGTAEYQALYKAWKADHRYPSWYAKLLASIVDGKVPSFVAGTAPTPPQQNDDDRMD